MRARPGPQRGAILLRALTNSVVAGIARGPGEAQGLSLSWLLGNQPATGRPRRRPRSTPSRGPVPARTARLVPAHPRLAGWRPGPALPSRGFGGTREAGTRSVRALPADPPCPDCGHRCPVRPPPRPLAAHGGALGYREPVGYGPACRRGLFPPAARRTPARASLPPDLLRRIATPAGPLRSFDQAATASESAAALHLSGRHAQRLTQEAGADLARQRDAQAAPYRRREPKPRAPEPPPLAAVEADGGRLGTRQRGAGGASVPGQGG
jgi:hypothetical protein